MEPAVLTGPPAMEDAPGVAAPDGEPAKVAPAAPPATDAPAGRGGEGADSVLPFLRELERDRVKPTDHAA